MVFDEIRIIKFDSKLLKSIFATTKFRLVFDIFFLTLLSTLEKVNLVLSLMELARCSVDDPCSPMTISFAEVDARKFMVRDRPEVKLAIRL